MTGIRDALTRRLGPLPAWAWLLGFAVGIVVYRRWRASSTTVATGASGEVVDTTTGPGDPVTVEPGQGVYDPATGQLRTVAPEQLPLDPVTIEPGQSVYDPNRGTTSTPGTGGGSGTGTGGTGSGGTTPDKSIDKSSVGGTPTGSKGDKPDKSISKSSIGKKGGGRTHHTTPHTGTGKPHNSRNHKNKPAGTPGPAAPIPTTGKTIPRALGTIHDTVRSIIVRPVINPNAAPVTTGVPAIPPRMTPTPVIPRANPTPHVAPTPPVRVPSPTPAPRGPVLAHVDKAPPRQAAPPPQHHAAPPPKSVSKRGK